MPCLLESYLADMAVQDNDAIVLDEEEQVEDIEIAIHTNVPLVCSFNKFLNIVENIILLV